MSSAIRIYMTAVLLILVICSVALVLKNPDVVSLELFIWDTWLLPIGGWLAIFGLLGFILGILYHVIRVAPDQIKRKRLEKQVTGLKKEVEVLQARLNIE